MLDGDDRAPSRHGHASNKKHKAHKEKGQKELDDDRTWSAAKWIRAPAIIQCLAKAILGGESPVDELAAMRAFARSTDEVRLRTAICARLATCVNELADLLLPRLQALAVADAASEEELHSKFNQAGAFELKHHGLMAFFAGLEGMVGVPSPGSVHDVLEAMEAEHTRGAEAIEPFSTGNYGITTTSKLEWRFVVAPDKPPPEGWPLETIVDGRPVGDGFIVDEQGTRVSVMRQPCSCEQLRHSMGQTNEKLRAIGEPALVWAEAVAGRLYTGPLFFKYNGALRGLSWGSYEAPPFLQNTMIKLCCPRHVFEQYIGVAQMWERVPSDRYATAKVHLNVYTTTLHAINSIVVKCGKLTKASKVYQGMSGAKPPAEFWEPDRFGCRGGVEPGFMSTTLSRQVAMGYASGQPAKGSIIFECQQGMTSRGAEIAWLSQYPHEREILFGPLTAREVLDTDVQDSTLVIRVRLSVNLASPTVERVIGKMQAAHLDLLSILQHKIAKDSPSEVPKLLHLRREAEGKSADFFNGAEAFKERTNVALDIKGRIEFQTLFSHLQSKKKFDLSYGNFRSFYAGLTGLIGAAETSSEPVRFEAMRLEHCESADSCVPFAQFMAECGRTLRTTPMIEWFFVNEPTDTRLAKLRQVLALDPKRTGIPLNAWPVEGELSDGGSGSKTRTPRSLSEFESKRREVNEKLATLGVGPMTDAELVAIRLYTGNMGKARYNVAVRVKSGTAAHLEQRFANEQCSNTYTTTCHTINDGVCRLGKIARAQVVWRGVSGGLPLASFLEPGLQHVAGGVEFIPAGCSPDEEVAVYWAMFDPSVTGLVFEIHQGVDRGAETGVFSDYPELSEVTLPPCCFMEVTGCRVKRNFTTISGYHHEGSVLYVDVSPQFHQGR